jgi:hypothetical protein
MAFWGLRDNMFTENTLDRWGRDFEEMKTHTFADGGRHALEDEFEVIFPLLRRFLAEGIEAKLPL